MRKNPQDYGFPAPPASGFYCWKCSNPIKGEEPSFLQVAGDPSGAFRAHHPECAEEQEKDELYDSGF